MENRLSPTVTAVITALFNPEDHATIAEMLTEECNAGRFHISSTEAVERIQLAVLKISKGKIEKFLAAAELAQLDWRDALIIAGFGNDVEAHLNWAKKFMK